MSLTLTFSSEVADAQRTGDCWLYGQPFLHDGARYRVVRYYVQGDKPVSVTIVLEPWPD